MCEEEREELEVVAQVSTEPVADSHHDPGAPAECNRMVGVVIGDQMHIGHSDRHTQAVARLVARGFREYERYSKSAPIEPSSLELNEAVGGAIVYRMSMNMRPGPTLTSPAVMKYEVTAKHVGGGGWLPVAPVTRGSWAQRQ